MYIVLLMKLYFYKHVCSICKKNQKIMTKKLVFALSTLLVINACKKSSDETPAPTNNNSTGISTVPSSFTQKALLEEFTGAWCTTCPDAHLKRDQVVAAHAGKAIAVSVHETDAMEIPLIWTLDATFSTNIPSGMINRTPSSGNVILNQTQWLSNATLALGKTAKCGLAINSSVSGTTASIEVHAGFNQTITGNYNLTVYLVENKVTGSGSEYNQANAYNNSSGSPFYNKGNPIINYEHNYVVRKVLTANMGDAIDGAKMVSGGDYKKTFSASVSGYDLNELYLVAFVNKIGTSSTTHEIMNVQQAKIGTLKNWD